MSQKDDLDSDEAEPNQKLRRALNHLAYTSSEQVKNINSKCLDSKIETQGKYKSQEGPGW